MENRDPKKRAGFCSGDLKMSSNKSALVLYLLLALVLFTVYSADVEGSGQGSAKDGILLHGDTSVPDQELLKEYGEKVPDDVYLMALCEKMAPVHFLHDKHVKSGLARCGNCHHKDPKDIKTCSECHPYKPKDKENVKYQDAHHKLCHTCHKAMKKGKQGPPTKCVKCHLRVNTEAAGSECPKPKN